MNALELRKAFLDLLADIRSAGRGASRDLLGEMIDTRLPAILTASDDAQDQHVVDSTRESMLQALLTTTRARIELGGADVSPRDGFPIRPTRKVGISARYPNALPNWQWSLGVAGAAAILVLIGWYLGLFSPSKQYYVRPEPRVVRPGEAPAPKETHRPSGPIVRGAPAPKSPTRGGAWTPPNKRTAGPQDLESGVLVAVVGEPLVFLTPNSDPVIGIPGMRIPVGSTIQTGDADRCELKFFEGTTIQWDFNSKGTLLNSKNRSGLVASGTRPIPRPESISLEQGKLYASVTHLPEHERFRIETPAATAEVLGTEFELSVEPSKDKGNLSGHRARLRVNDGRVAFYNALGRIEAPMNTESWATETTKPTEPKRIPRYGRFQVTDFYSWVRETSVLDRATAFERVASPLGQCGLAAARSENLGILVTRIDPGFSADKAGLKPGDALLSIDGKPVETVAGFGRAIAVAFGETVRITVRRSLQVLDLPLHVEPDYAKKSLGASDPELAAIVWSGLNGDRAEALHQLSAPRYASNPRAQNDIGIFHEMNDDLGPAIRSYRRAIALSPKTPLYHINLGVALRTIGNPTRALEEFEEAGRLDANWVMPLCWQAMVLPEMGRLDDAERIADEVVKRFPTKAAAWRSRSTVLDIAGKFVEAVEAAKKAVEIEPNDHGSWKAMGDALSIMRDDVGAEKALRKSIELDPSCPHAVVNLGQLLVRTHRSAEAETVMRKSLLLKPEIAVKYNNLAVFLFDRGRPTEGEKMYRRSMAAVPNSPDAYSSLANRWARTGNGGINLDEAIVLAKKGVALSNGRSFFELFTLGLVHQQRKEWREAEQAYLRCADIAGLNNTYDWLWNRIYETKQQQGDAKGAIDLLRSLMKREPPVISAASVLARALRDAGRLDESFDLLRGHLKSHPEDRGSVIAFANDYWANQAQVVDECVRAALAKSPQDAELQFYAGRSAIAVGDYARADQLLDAARKKLDLLPDWMRVPSFTHLAEAREKLGNIPGAVETLLEACYVKFYAMDQVFYIYNNLVRFKPKEAHAYLARVVAQSSDKPNAMVEMARYHFDFGHLDQAENLCRDVLELKPDVPSSVRAEAWMRRGAILERKGQNAMKEFYAALKADPGSLWALYTLIDRIHHLRPDEALVYARRAVAIEPNGTRSYVKLGKVLIRKQKLDDAEREIKRGLSLKQADGITLAEAWFLLGEIAEKRSKIELARAHYRKAREYGPNEPWILSATRRLGVPDTEEEQLLKSLEAKPAPSPGAQRDTWNSLAQLYAKNALPEKAIAAYGKALELDPKARGIWLGLAYHFYNIGREREAIVPFRKALEIDPNDSGASSLLAWILLKYEGKYEEALKLAQKAIEIDPSNGDAYANAGRAAYKLGDFARAEQYLHKALFGTEWGKHSDSAMAWLELGIAYEDAGKKEQAFEAFKTAIRFNPKEPTVLEGLKRGGGRYSMLEAYRAILFEKPDQKDARRQLIELLPNLEAIVELRAMLKDFPNDYWALKTLARNLTWDHPVEGLALMKRAVAVTPDDPQLLLQFATLQIRAGELKDGERTLGKLLTMQPPPETWIIRDTWRQYGELYAKRGEHLRAVEAIKKATELEKGDSSIWAELGKAYAAAQRSNEAEAAFRKGLEMQPESFDVWWSLGAFHDSLGQYAKANSAYKRALEIRPTAGWILYAYGKNCYRLGQDQEAEKAWKKALEQFPNNLNILGNVAWLLIDEGVHLSLALELALKSYDMNPQDSNGVSNVGIAYFKLNDFIKAEKYLEEAMVGTPFGTQKHPDIALCWSFLGLTYEKLGKKQKAIEAFRTALDLDSKDKTAIEGLKRLGG